jgi:hypothetical protein
MHQRIDLAGGSVNHGRLLVELIEPPDTPPIIAISWPSAATIGTPDAFPATAAAVARVFTESAIALARSKVYGK